MISQARQRIRALALSVTFISISGLSPTWAQPAQEFADKGTGRARRPVLAMARTIAAQYMSPSVHVAVGARTTAGSAASSAGSR